MSIKALLSALGFILLVGTFAFSLWAEWGPYSWVVSAQMAIMDSYMQKLTFILTFLLFFAPAIILQLSFTSAGGAAKLIGFGIPGLLVLAHFALTAWLVGTGGTQLEGASFDTAVRQAGFIPQNITLDRRQLPDLKLDQASSLQSSGSSEELYIPFAPASWPSPDTMVVLKTSPDRLQKLAQADELQGVLRKTPLPYLVRKSWPRNPSLFAIIIEDKASTRTLLLPAAFIYLLAIIGGISHLFKSRRARSAPPPAA
ncbi:hypothetical protein [Prosthecobacter sp.]|uniref:hypothetical protein n=1 Tax=Prosthecobacter sp. TaxID=1965333 RepID=UPI003784C3A2